MVHRINGSQFTQFLSDQGTSFFSDCFLHRMNSDWHTITIYCKLTNYIKYHDFLFSDLSVTELTESRSKFLWKKLKVGQDTDRELEILSMQTIWCNNNYAKWFLRQLSKLWITIPISDKRKDGRLPTCSQFDKNKMTELLVYKCSFVNTHLDPLNTKHVSHFPCVWSLLKFGLVYQIFLCEFINLRVDP